MQKTSYSRDDFKTVQIRAYLQTPVISDRYLPLDSILYNQAVRERFGPKTITKSRASTVPQGANVSLPIMKRNMKTPEWYYAMSFAMWPDHASRDKYQYAKRFRMKHAENYLDFKGKREKVRTDAGQYKNSFIEEYTYNAQYIDWYGRVAIDPVKQLLAFCTHIGKKTSQGCGAVLRWEITETDRDWYMNDGMGRTTRAIPFKGGEQIYGIRPSYWNPKHHTRVLLPN